MLEQPTHRQSSCGDADARYRVGDAVMGRHPMPARQGHDGVRLESLRPLYSPSTRLHDGRVKPWVKGAGVALFYVLAAIVLIWALSVVVNQL
ncbi:hypothetical protein ACTWPT_40665 [Nonomuraea sp. 3N208]|uniref:hypothetical protein n=1 Tax=Nonomuraea sp. 3N208 TaxID=3457421 RepID=UPI003FD13BA8